MPRTKRQKKTSGKNSGEVMNPSIVIKQEPLDVPDDKMEIVDGIDSASTRSHYLNKMRTVVGGMKSDTRRRYDQLVATVVHRLDALNMKIPAEYRNTPLADIEEALAAQGATSVISISSLSNTQCPDGSEVNSMLSSEDKTRIAELTNAEVDSSNSFKTPLMGQSSPRYPTITPKVRPNSPVTIMRRPKLGEVVLSMRGSPVMLNAARDDKATVNIPLPDGAVMSIMPEKGLHSVELPSNVDQKTKEQIKVIWETLGQIIETSP